MRYLRCYLYYNVNVISKPSLYLLIISLLYLDSMWKLWTISKIFSVNLENFRDVLEGMDTPTTDIHTADDATSSIKAFGDSFHNAFKEVSKPH